jgi:hypothetical protein
MNHVVEDLTEIHHSTGRCPPLPWDERDDRVLVATSSLVFRCLFACLKPLNTLVAPKDIVCA